MSAERLALEMRVSRRTLFRDLQTLEAAGIPYTCKPGEGYRIPPSFFLPPVNLRVTEAMGLMTLAKSALERREQPMLGPAVEGVRKLMAMIPAPLRDICGQMMRRVSVRGGAKSAVNGDDRHFGLIQQAIDESRVIQMRYGSLFEGGDIELRLRPYHLHYSVRAWYVIGHSEKHRQIRIFKLSRVHEMKLLDRKFNPRSSFDVEKFFGLCWNMIPEGKVHHVELEFAPKVAVNVAEVRWHPTQKQRMLPDGRLIVEFDVDGLGEISWWLMGYGDQVLVRQPGALAERLEQVHRSAIEKYAHARKEKG